ncbi:tetratricopeptide repeat protein, partial [Akkermansiaceae bacterium]|nr:tetratricopeptide repeat protein [Akkermansiaceae bacterium]
ESDRRQQLITQNVGLSKELIEARKKLELINDDSNASKNQIIKAKVALEMAKSKILSLQKENKASELRLAELEKRLKLAQSDLLAGANGTGSPLERQEAELLRQVVKRLQVQIKAQKKTGELLVAQAKRMGLKDEAWSQAVDQLTEAYTPTLEDIEAEAALSHSVTNRISTTPAERLAAQDRLQRLTRDLDRVAHRLFAKEDFQAARGNLELIVEEDPGAWPAMVNLGIVQMRLKDPAEAAKHFKQAILVAGEQKVPYAHFLLGDAYYKTELYPDAQSELQSSLSMDPQNAKAHIILGNIAGRSGDYEKAEFHFKEAISIDPTLHEPHKNLAVLRYRENKLTEAKVHYRDALRLGAPADSALEEALDIN